MKIVKQDKNLMILEEKGVMLLVIGIIFLLLGFLLIFEPKFFENQIPVWISFIIILSGVLAVFFAEFTTISFDKKSNKLLLSRKGLKNRSVKEYKLDWIKKVEVFAEYIPSGGESTGGYSYHLSVVLSNGEIVQLNLGGSSITRIRGKQIIPEETLGAKIADFLRVPFEEIQSLQVKLLKGMEKQAKQKS
ncbi:MAG: hypothetical protein WC651_03660 [Candidatus Gracilibacteria bacterium]